MATAEARYETALERLTSALEGFRKDQESFRKDQERMRGDLTSAQETLRGDLTTAQETLRGDLTSAQETLRTEMTRRDAEASKREVRHLLAVITAIGVAVAFLAFQDDRQISTGQPAPVPAAQNPVAPANQ